MLTPAEQGERAMWEAWERGEARCPYCIGLSMRDFEAVCAGYDWHATQHIAGLTHDGHDLRALHVEDVNALIESRKRAQDALAALRDSLGAGE